LSSVGLVGLKAALLQLPLNKYVKQNHKKKLGKWLFKPKIDLWSKNALLSLNQFVMIHYLNKKINHLGVFGLLD
jgi:hypothetical protein